MPDVMATSGDMALTDRKRLLLWFCAGLVVPLALAGLAALTQLLHLPALQSTFALLALGSCPFWLFLWIPAMSHPDSHLLFYSAAAAVLLANGALYLVMAKVQILTRHWTLPLRLAAVVVAYPALMAIGYCVPLGLEYLSIMGTDGRLGKVQLWTEIEDPPAIDQESKAQLYISNAKGERLERSNTVYVVRFNKPSELHAAHVIATLSPRRFGDPHCAPDARLSLALGIDRRGGCGNDGHLAV